MKRSLIIVTLLAILVAGCAIAPCPYGHDGYGNGGYFPPSTIRYPGYCQYSYPATQFVPGPYGTNYRIDGVIVGNPIYGGRFYPASPYRY